jgi:hypothetical protein
MDKTYKSFNGYNKSSSTCSSVPLAILLRKFSITFVRLKSEIIAFAKKNAFFYLTISKTEA